MNSSFNSVEEWENGFRGYYKGHFLNIERDHPSGDWYILVQDQTGECLYDGYFRDSKRLGLGSAIIQALKGSMLIDEETAKKMNAVYEF